MQETIGMKSVLAAMTLVAVLSMGCTTSDVIMTGDSRPATSPDMVKFYLRAPAAFTSIGLVTASSNSTPVRSKNKERALAELRAKAAQLGANGIILTQTNASTGSSGTVYVPPGSNVGVVSSGRGSEVEVQGEAIWVEE
jgi:uncharacterized protein YbjQ (UPF0145 family)